MMKQNNTGRKKLTLGESYEQRLSVVRVDIFALILLTVINTVIVATGGDTYYLFSAAVPYYMVSIAVAMTGHLPADIYADPENGWVGFEFLPDMYLYVAVIAAVLILALYVFCAVFAKRHYGWVIAAAVLFGIDTLAMFGFFGLYGFAGSDIFDVAIHIWVLVVFILCAVAGYKRAHGKGVPETTAPETEGAENRDENDNTDNT